MKIIGVETLQMQEASNLVWVRLHTDEGLVGLGETFRNPDAVIAYIHSTAAPALIGKDPTRRAALMHEISRRIGNHFNGFPSRSVEVSGNSAVDIALWDLFGKIQNQPVYQLIGGMVQDKIKVYNTCAGARYNNRVRAGYNTELISRDDPAPKKIDRHDDLLLQVFEPARLAAELLAEGITAMKIWPFDPFALRNRGNEISASEMRKALWPIEQIRNSVGDKMDIMIEYHGLWKLPVALEIADALKDYNIYWHEEPIWMQNFDDLAIYRSKVGGRVAGSENFGTSVWYREVFSRRAVDVANFDVAWIGGLSEALKVMHLADAFDRVIAPHDCTGPVTLGANVHLLAASTNGLICETVRAHTQGFYAEIVDSVPVVENGFISPSSNPGLGMALSEDFLKRGDLNRRISGTAAQ
ncbi:mandelate racemase/muconate lactonizing enzyme family protein [Ochrobactrum sp. EDr1-4]|uniref:mandelate racemase/muconate lactonizing enzyme family protein n=1 Tax=Ochrobactrum sp. EDr1-4 TaxID=3368622 RepID=UPI003BA259C9